MCSSKTTKYQRFFWSGGEDGSAFYTKNLAIHLRNSQDTVKYMLASAIGDLGVLLDQQNYHVLRNNAGHLFIILSSNN